MVGRGTGGRAQQVETNEEAGGRRFEEKQTETDGDGDGWAANKTKPLVSEANVLVSRGQNRVFFLMFCLLYFSMYVIVGVSMTLTLVRSDQFIHRFLARGMATPVCQLQIA